MPSSPRSRLPLHRTTAFAVLLLCWATPQSAPAWAADGPTAPPAAIRAEAPERTPDTADGLSGYGSAGVVPIIMGLVLTGVAVYKHRGLPRGH